MNSNRQALSAVFQTVVSFVIFFGTIGLVVLLVLNKKKPLQQAIVSRVPLVDLIEVNDYADDVKINVTGVTMPFREVTIAAEVTGVITFKSEHCKAGRYVDLDTPADRHLMSIDSEKYGLAVKRLQLEVEEAEVRRKRVADELQAAREILQLTKSDFDLQQRERDRMAGLYQSKVISETEWNQSQRTYNAAANAKTTQESRVGSLQADLAAQQSLVALKKVQLEEARIDERKAVIEAPSTGVIISDDVQQDDFVQVGQKLLVFEDTSAAEVRCDLRSDQLQAILDSQPEITTERDRFKLPPLPCRIEYKSNDQTYQWSGRLDRYDGLGLDDRTRTAPCIIHVDDTLSKDGKRTLVRGMYVSVELNLGVQEGLVAIPAEALRAGNVVWVYKPLDQVMGELRELHGEDLPADKLTAIEEAKKSLLVDGKTGKESLGQLNKISVKVTNRITDKLGQEWVVAKTDGSVFSKNDLLVANPIPQPIDKDWLRCKTGSVRKVKFHEGESIRFQRDEQTTSQRDEPDAKQKRLDNPSAEVQPGREVIR